MTKKHFKRIAEVILLAKPYAQGCEQAEKIVRDIAGSLAQVCAENNTRFDKARFLKACGYGN